jgi:hypothetical protein
VPQHDEFVTHWHMTFHVILFLTQPTVSTRRNINVAVYIKARYENSLQGAAKQ